MSDETQGPGTKVDRYVGLPPHMVAHIEERKRKNAMAAAISAQTWAKDIDASTARAVAEYCHTHDIDPATEIEVLGGRLYKNARYYERRFNEMSAAGLVEYCHREHVNVDPRLDELAKGDDAELAAWAKGERGRRTRARIGFNLKDEAKGAVVCRIKLLNVAGEFVGAEACGDGAKNYKGGLADPVGENEPAKTAESRALRRAMLLAMQAVPDLRTREDAFVAGAGEIVIEPETIRRTTTPPLASSDGAYGAAAPSLPPAPLAVSAADPEDLELDQLLTSEDAA